MLILRRRLASGLRWREVVSGSAELDPVKHVGVSVERGCGAKAGGGSDGLEAGLGVDGPFGFEAGRFQQFENHIGAVVFHGELAFELGVSESRGGVEGDDGDWVWGAWDGGHEQAGSPGQEKLIIDLGAGFERVIFQLIWGK